MDDQMVQRVLTAHADALNQGVNNTEWLLKQFGHRDSYQRHELESLLTIANQLKIVLVPVPCDTQFAESLGEALRAMDTRQPALTPDKRPWGWWGAAAAGSVAAGVAGLIVWRLTRPNEQFASPQG